MNLLIAIVVIGVLAAMMILSSTEAVTTAQASNIVANLTHIRKAVIAWYGDNIKRIKYIPQNSGGTDIKFYFNDVKYNSIQDALSGKAHSSQTSDTADKNQVVSFVNYLDGIHGVNEKGDITQYKWSYLADGGYGVNDAGTEWRRATWFAGYTFKEGEEILKRKIWGRKDALGLFFTTGNRPNEHGHKPITDESQIDSANSVWLRIMGDAPCDGVENNYK